jgi:hypothetical protein
MIKTSESPFCNHGGFCRGGRGNNDSKNATEMDQTVPTHIYTKSPSANNNFPLLQTILTV